jgi:hypothetical protein
VAIEPTLAVPLVICWMVGGLILLVAAWLLGVIHALKNDILCVVFFFLIPFYFVKYAIQNWPHTRTSAIAQLALLAWLTVPPMISFPVVLVASLFWDVDADAVVQTEGPDERQPRVEANRDSEPQPSSDLIDVPPETQQQLLKQLTYEPPEGITLRYRATVTMKSESPFVGTETTNNIIELRLTSLGTIAPQTTGMLGKFEALKHVEKDDDGTETVIDAAAGVARNQVGDTPFSMPMNPEAARAFLEEPVKYSIRHDAQKIVEMRLKDSLAIYTDNTPNDVAMVTVPMKEAFRRATDAIWMPLPSQPSEAEPVWYTHHAGGDGLEEVLSTEYRLSLRQPKGDSPIVVVQVRGGAQAIKDKPNYEMRTRITRTGEYHFNTSGRIAESGVLVEEETRVGRRKEDGKQSTSRWRLEVRFALIEAALGVADPEALAQFDRGTNEIEYPREAGAGPLGSDQGPALLTEEDLEAADQLAADVARPKIIGDLFKSGADVAGSVAPPDAKASAKAPATKPPATSVPLPKPIQPPREKLTPSDGFEIVASNAALPPGLPAQIRYRTRWSTDATWHDCEILRVEPDGSVTVRLFPDPSMYPDPKWTKGMHLVQGPRAMLAVRPDDLKRAVAEPGLFVPSVRLLPGTHTVIGEDEVLIPDDLPLVPGIPLRVITGGFEQFSKATLILPAQDGRLICYSESGHLSAVDRSKSAIDRSVVEELRDPESAAEKYGGNLASVLAEFDKRPSGRIRDYHITKSLPDGFEALAPNTPVPLGASVKAEWDQTWYDLTVVRDSQEGNVLVYWNEWSDVWIYYITRSSLIIDGNVQARLRESALLKLAEEEPRSPSVRLLPGTQTPLGEDEIPIPDDLRLVPGIPLRLVNGGPSRYGNATLISPTQDHRLIYSSEDSPGRLSAANRSKFAIERSVVEYLRDPESPAAEYAGNLKRVMAEFDKRPPGSIRDYRITKSLPAGFETLVADTPVPLGASVKAEWGGKWHDLTVVRDSTKGKMLVYWNEWSNVWIYYITRSSLIIEGNEQAQLRESALRNVDRQ